jgi:hypothetical protein
VIGALAAATVAFGVALGAPSLVSAGHVRPRPCRSHGSPARLRTCHLCRLTFAEAMSSPITVVAATLAGMCGPALVIAFEAATATVGPRFRHSAQRRSCEA